LFSTSPKTKKYSINNLLLSYKKIFVIESKPSISRINGSAVLWTGALIIQKKEAADM